MLNYLYFYTVEFDSNFELEITLLSLSTHLEINGPSLNIENYLNQIEIRLYEKLYLPLAILQKKRWDS